MKPSKQAPKLLSPKRPLGNPKDKPLTLEEVGQRLKNIEASQRKILDILTQAHIYSVSDAPVDTKRSFWRKG